MANCINLSDLRKGNPALTSAMGCSIEEACVVCLCDQDHNPGVDLTIDGIVNTSVKIDWQTQVTDQMRRCWGDDEVTTENAAYGIAFLLIPKFTNFLPIEKSFKGTGFDYFLGEKQESEDLIFNNKARLEVSGIRRGTQSQINSRIRKKFAQTAPTDAKKIPAYIVVVEFSKPFSHIGEKKI